MVSLAESFFVLARREAESIFAEPIVEAERQSQGEKGPVRRPLRIVPGYIGPYSPRAERCSRMFSSRTFSRQPYSEPPLDPCDWTGDILADTTWPSWWGKAVRTRVSVEAQVKGASITPTAWRPRGDLRKKNRF